MRNAARIILLLLAPLTVLMIPIAAQSQMTLKEGAPPGFEALNAPRPTAVTLYHGGKLLGVFPAHTMPGTLQLDDPKPIIDAIAAINNPTLIASILTKPMPANADKLCRAKHREDCGMLAPDIVGVIFDENRLNAELFINRQYLAVSDLTATHYLPLPQRQFSSIYGFTGAVSGVDATTPNFSLTNNAIYAFGEGRFTTQSTVSNDGLRFDTAAATIERQGWNATAGLFRSQAMELLSDRDMAGVSWSSSMRTRIDKHRMQGNDIILYLPRRSFVSIYREGRLYSSRTYEAGNQNIDTSELPDGAYTITLRIQEIGGATREENRFYAKSQELPPEGQPLYYAQAGVLRNIASADSALPELTGDPILRLGTVRRLADNIGFGIGALGVADRGAVETGLFWLKPGVQLRSTLLASSRGDVGVQAGYLHTTDKMSITADARKLFISAHPIPGFEDLAHDIAQAALTVSYAATPELLIGMRSSFAESTNFPASISFGPYAEWRIWQEGENMLGISADLARNNDEVQGNLILHFSRRFGAKYGITSHAGGGFGGASRGPSASAYLWRDDSTPGNTSLISAGLSGDNHQQAMSVDADWDNNLGQFHGSAQQSFGETSLLNYGGSFAIGAAQLSTDVLLGGHQNDKSAVIISASGDANAEMKIYVNGVERNAVNVGKQQVLYFSPFHSYHIRLAPAQQGLIDYDSNDRKVTLYPGNVVKMDWQVNNFYVVAGRVVTPDGAPLANASLKESRAQNVTDANGRLQAELSKPKRLTFTREKLPPCEVTLPQGIAPINGALLYPEPLICVPTL